MKFLDHLKYIASSPLAFVGYALVIFLWGYRYWVINHPKSKLKEILLTFKSDTEKIRAVKLLTGTEPPTGLTGSQILKWYEINNKQKSKSLLLLAYSFTLLTLIVVIGLAFYKSSSKEESHKPPILIDERVNKNY